jgi:membrane-associated phospholipid phosphatase
MPVERAPHPHERSHPNKHHRWLTGLLLVASLALAIPLFVALYRAFDIFGFPGALGVLIAIGLILAVAWFVHLIRTFGGPFVAVVGSVATSVAHGVQGDPFVSEAERRLAGPTARPLEYVRRRLDPHERTGLFLTMSLVLIGVLVVAFVDVTLQVLHHGPLVAIDTRIANLVDLVHRGAAVHAATFFTLIGGAPFRIPLSIALFGLVWWRRPNLRWLIGFGIVLVLGPLLSDAGRQLVRRPRPAVGAAALPGSFSFPSGHASAAAASYGYIAYLAIRRAKRLRWQILVAAAAALTIVGVGYSRVVLGFHWSSDVLAGTLLGLLIAAGAALYADIRQGRELRWPRRLPIAPWIFGAVAVALVAVAAMSAARRPQHAPVLSALPATPLPDAAVTRATLRSFPLYSETLTGRRMEPVSLILVGSREQVIAAFRAAGWSLADPVDLHTVLRIYGSGLRHQAYPNAPVTPAFLGDRPQDLAFERDVEAGSVAKRHHARVWFSGHTLSDGSPVWLATASLDDRLEIKVTTLLPNHHIAPDIDTERDLIARALLSTGLVQGESTVQAVQPQLGTNAAGDPFFTNGKAIVVTLGS